MSNRKLDELLDVWMSDRDRGVIRTAAELCAETPELVEELTRRIQVLKRFEQLADMNQSETLVSQGEVDTSQSTNSPVPTTVQTSSLPVSIGNFKPLKILGEGGMGAVYLAEDPQLGRRVAVKVMKKELAADPEAKHRFLREARAMATIEHDNIMTIYAVGEDRGTPYLVMPVLKGETLDDRLRRESRLSVAETCRIGQEIAAGLAAAHSHSLIHRDIKPSNIWLEGSQGRVRILDFGLARPASDDQKVTHSGAVLGTPAYMAPEQAAGEEATPRSDLFSLGAVLYRMTTGLQPFAGPNVMATLNNLANRIPESPQKLAPELPAYISLLIDRLLSKTPEQRPESATAVLESLRNEETLPLPSITIVPGPPKKPQKTATVKIKPAKAKSAVRESPKPSSASGSQGITRLLLISGLAGFFLLAALVVYRIQTDHGTLVVQIEDDQVEAKLRKDGLKIVDAKTGRAWKLTPNQSASMPSGEYKLPKIDGLLLKVTDDSGTEFTTGEFKIKRGDQTTVKVTIEPTEQLEQVLSGSADQGFVKFGEPWKVASPGGIRVDGNVNAVWAGPNGSNIVIYTQQSPTPIHPVDLLATTAAGLKDKFNATIGSEAIRMIGGMQSMWIVAHGKGTGETIDGTGSTVTTQLLVGIPREEDILAIRLSCPSGDFPTLRTEFEASLGSMFLLNSQTEEQRTTRTPVTSRRAIPPGESPFDKLDPGQIPEKERLDYLPKDVVAVLGTHEQKTWGSQFHVSHGALSYSPDGKWICACDSSNTYLFDATTLALRKQVPSSLHFLSYRPYAFSSDSTRLFLGTCGLPEIVAGAMIDLSDPALPMQTLHQFGTTDVIANSPDNKLVAMSLYGGNHFGIQIAARDPETNYVSNLDVVPDVTELPSSTETGQIRELAFSPDGEWLISGHWQGGYRICRKKGELYLPVSVIPSQMPTYNARVVYSFTSEHKRALLLGHDICHLIDLAGDKPTELDAPADLHAVLDICTAPDGTIWAATKYIPGAPSQLLLGRWVSGIPVLQATEPLVGGKSPGLIAIAPDGIAVAIMGENRFLQITDISKLIPQLPAVAQPGAQNATKMSGGHSRSIAAATSQIAQFSMTAVNSRGDSAVTVKGDGRIDLESIGENSSTHRDSQSVGQPLTHVTLSSNGARVVTFTNPVVTTPIRHQIQVWRIEDQKLIEHGRFESSEDRIWVSPRLFADANRLLLGNQIWDISTTSPKVINEFSQVPPNPPNALPEDGQFVAFATTDGQLSVYAVAGATDRPLATTKLPGAPTSLEFSPDGQRLVASFPQGLCVVWDLANGRLVESLRMPAQWEIPPHGVMYHLTSAVFSRDGHRVYFSGWGGVGEWNLDENKVTRFWPLPGYAWLTMADDDRHLILNNSNCTTWILRLTQP
ncbi:MAG: protein kinase [Planctomycetaceae bacterium]